MRMIENSDSKSRQIFYLSLFLTPDEARRMIEALEQLIECNAMGNSSHEHFFDEFFAPDSIQALFEHYVKFHPKDEPALELVETERISYIKGVPLENNREIVLSVYDYEHTKEWKPEICRVLEDVYGRVDDVGAY